MAASAVRQGAKNLKIAVLKLPWTIGSRELQEHFGKFGTISFCQVIFDNKTGFSKGFGFVQFSEESAVNEALSTKHRLDGEAVQVEMTFTDDNHARPRFNRRVRIPPLANLLEDIGMTT